MLLQSLALNCTFLKVFLEHHAAHENMLKKKNIWVFVLQNKKSVWPDWRYKHLLGCQVTKGGETGWKPAHTTASSCTARTWAALSLLPQIQDAAAGEVRPREEEYRAHSLFHKAHMQQDPTLFFSPFCDATSSRILKQKRGETNVLLDHATGTHDWKMLHKADVDGWAAFWVPLQKEFLMVMGEAGFVSSLYPWDENPNTNIRYMISEAYHMLFITRQLVGLLKSL